MGKSGIHMGRVVGGQTSSENYSDSRGPRAALRPKQVRYRAAPHPDAKEFYHLAGTNPRKSLFNLSICSRLWNCTRSLESGLSRRLSMAHT